MKYLITGGCGFIGSNYINHLFNNNKVEKIISNGNTSTSLKKLITIKDKQDELAELIGGGFTEASNYALTLLNKAAA